MATNTKASEPAVDEQSLVEETGKEDGHSETLETLVHDEVDRGDEKVPLPRQMHSFLVDQAYVEQMEDGLLNLLNDFKQGNLNAFGE